MCPVGEEVIGPFLQSRKDHVQNTLRPLQEKPETLYVLPGSDAESFAQKRWKNKTTQRVSNGMQPTTLGNLFYFMPHIFQPKKADGFSATLHFAFHSPETRDVTVQISEGKLRVLNGFHGEADAQIRAHSRAWVDFVNGELSLPRALFLGRIKISGTKPHRWHAIQTLREFGKCFPGA